MLKVCKRIVIKVLALVLVCLIEIYRRIKPIPRRIYFCYNQSIHHIYHSLFIAIELSNIQNDFEVQVLSTSSRASCIIEEELATVSNNVKFIKIHHPGYNKANFSVNWFVFLCRLRMHKPAAVVVTDYFDNVFRQLLLKTFWVYSCHGPENRGYTHAHIKDYDLVILPGAGELKRIENRIGKINNYAITGYSKFDYLQYHKIGNLDLFKQEKPVILYNPHFDIMQSSFFDKGIELLDRLSKTGKYNIIFMPHPDLVRRYPELINKTETIADVVVLRHQKINLDFMAVSSIYITDVSSAVFEWLVFDKPVIFFNSKKIDWKVKGIYPAWECGVVAEDIQNMLDAVEGQLNNPLEFQEKRRELFNETFLNRDKNVSRLIAQTIWEKLQNAGK